MTIKQVPCLLRKRIFDLTLSVLGGLVILPVAVMVAIAVKLTSPGPALYWSKRVGAGERTFMMPKFRTMVVGTPALATHLIPDASALLTPIGGFLRKSSLDELPQLWSVLRGDMSIVGPRPALFNQVDLIAMRKIEGVNELLPGITGLAQTNGRDAISMATKVRYDAEYRNSMSLMMDIRIIIATILRVFRRDGISH